MNPKPDLVGPFRDYSPHFTIIYACLVVSSIWPSIWGSPVTGCQQTPEWHVSAATLDIPGVLNAWKINRLNGKSTINGGLTGKIVWKWAMVHCHVWWLAHQSNMACWKIHEILFGDEFPIQLPWVSAGWFCIATIDYRTVVTQVGVLPKPPKGHAGGMMKTILCHVFPGFLWRPWPFSRFRGFWPSIFAVSAHLWKRSHFSLGKSDFCWVKSLISVDEIDECPHFCRWTPDFLLLKCPLFVPPVFKPHRHLPAATKRHPFAARSQAAGACGVQMWGLRAAVEGKPSTKGHRIMLGNIGKMMGNIRKPSFFPNSSRKKGCYIRMFLLFFPAILEGVRMDLDKAGHSACAVLELVVHISTTLVFFPIDLHDHPWEKFCASGQQFFRESSMISYDNGNSGNHPWSVKTIVGSSGNHHPSTIFSSMIIWEFVLSTRTAQRW